MSQKLSFSKDKIKIVLFEGIHPYAVEHLNKNGYTNVELLKKAYVGEELYEKLASTHVIGIRSRTKVTEEVLAHAPRLMAIGCFCIGTNQVDLSAAAAKGIPVFNAPHSNTRSVAELVVAEAVMLMRGAFEKSFNAHHGRWMKSAANSREVRGKTFGIVGYGHIGTQASVLAESMGMNVLFYDIQAKLPMGNAKACDSLAELLGKSDVVSLHVPEDHTTKNLMNRDAIFAMKQGAYLINASRGSVVDIPALKDALDQEHIKGAAVDVFPTEPKSNDDPFESELIGHHNVILTPHVGGSTIEAQENIGVEVAGKLVAYSDYGVTEGAVNFPQVNMPMRADAHRILHIHRNIPGMLQQINRIIADEGINVLGQYLGTDGDLGYVVLDIAKGMSDRLLKILKEVDGTLRARVLF